MCIVVRSYRMMKGEVKHNTILNLKKDQLNIKHLATFVVSGFIETFRPLKGGGLDAGNGTLIQGNGHNIPFLDMNLICLSFLKYLVFVFSQCKEFVMEW